MKILTTLSFFISFSAFASNVQWNDLELYNEYKTTQEIVFDNGVTFPAGEVFEMRLMDPLTIPGYPMLYLQFHQKNCVNVDQTADLSLLTIGSTVVGIEMEEGCNLGMYLEVKDVYSDSSFE